MKNILRLLFALVAMLVALRSPQAKGQELIVNGNFETANLNGWTASGTSAAVISSSTNVISGNYSASLTGESLSQVISTVPGASYRISCKMRPSGGTSPSSIIASGSTSLDVLATASAPILSSSVYTVATCFIADSTTTTVSVTAGTPATIIPGITPITIPGTSGYVDDVSAKKMVFSHGGHYTGKVTTTVTFDKVTLDTSRAANVFGRIDSAGRVFLTDASGEEWTGFVQDDGVVQFASISGSGMKFAAGVLKFSLFESTISSAFGFGLNENRTESFVLTRVGP